MPPAVRVACEAACGKLLELARDDPQLGWHNLPAETLRLQSASLEDAARRFCRHAFGAPFAEVHVDPELGTIRVSRRVGAFDDGRVLNAKTARSQPVGGIAFGIGMALLEETRVDRRTGRTVKATLRSTCCR